MAIIFWEKQVKLITVTHTVTAQNSITLYVFAQVVIHIEVEWHKASVKQASINLRPKQNVRHFTDDIFKCIILIENVWISIKVLLTFVPNGPIDNTEALVQIMAWRWPAITWTNSV